MEEYFRLKVERMEHFRNIVQGALEEALAETGDSNIFVSQFPGTELDETGIINIEVKSDKIEKLWINWHPEVGIVSLTYIEVNEKGKGLGNRVYAAVEEIARRVKATRVEMEGINAIYDPDTSSEFWLSKGYIVSDTIAYKEL
ncbi:MAG: hypothetical protein PHS44_07380 [Candidatus Dojkabacteria bacterium]|nr:hypothetical protein [Candidatus Dojkabacteria bacterium]